MYVAKSYHNNYDGSKAISANNNSDLYPRLHHSSLSPIWKAICSYNIDFVA